MSMETGVHYPLRIDTLPRGWRAGYVGDFAKEIEPGFASGEHNQNGEGVAHLRPMNVDREGKIDLSVTKFVSANKDGRRLAVGDVLFNNTNSPELVGKTAAVSVAGDFAFSNHMTRIRFADNVLPKFGALQLHFLWMRGYFKYNCVKHINQASVSSRALAHSVPFVWAPPAEQERIVAEIEKQFSRLDEAVANLKRVKANLKRQTAAILSAAISGELFDRAAPHVAADRPELAPAINLPSAWSWASAAELCELVASGSTPKADEMTSGAGEVPFIKVYNLGFDGSLDFTVKPTFIRRAVHEGLLARSRCLPGDVLMNIVGPPLGKVSLVPDAFPEWNINQAIVTFRAGPRILDSLLAYWLMSPPVQRRIERTSKATAGQYNVQVSTCRKLVLPLPPLDEQYRIVAEVDRRLSIVREVEAEVEANLKRAQALRQAVLARAFAASREPGQ